MSFETVELKHGDLQARLLFCNRAYRDARHELGNLFSLDDLQNEVRTLNFLVTYLYQAYVCDCKNEMKPITIKWLDFDEAITAKDVPQTESNLGQIMDRAGETIKVSFETEIENVKKKVEEIVKNNPNPQTTNSNNSSVENLDTGQESSGTA